MDRAAAHALSEQAAPRFQALDGADREAVRSLLEGTGCEPLMEPGA